MAELAGKKIPEKWQHDGVSFAPLIHGHPGARPRDWAFFWYDPRPGWDKMAFSRAIFALDHNYKLFADGRFFAIDGVDYKEDPLPAENLSPKAEAAKTKLKKVIADMMKAPISKAALIEVDAFGDPVKSR